MVILPGPTQSAGGLASAVGVMVFACVAVGVVPGTGMLLPVASKTPEALAFLLVGIVAGGGMLILPVASKAPEALASIVVGISLVASNAAALALEALPEYVPASPVLLGGGGEAVAGGSGGAPVVLGGVVGAAWGGGDVTVGVGFGGCGGGGGGWSYGAALALAFVAL